MSEFLICALRNLGRKKLRTVLTVMGITIGVASVIIIGAIGRGGRIAISDQMDSLGINGLNIASKMSSDGSQAMIAAEDVKDCLAVSGVQDAMPVIMQMGMSLFHGYEKDALFWGVGSDAGRIISLKMSYGSMFTQDDVNTHARVCMVDDTFALDAYKRANITGKSITVYLGNGYQQLTVKGVVASGSSILYNLVGDYMPSFIYLPYTTAEDLRGKDGYDQIAVKTVSNHNIDQIGDHIVDVLSSQHRDEVFTASNMFEQKQRLNNMLGIITLVISAVGAISMVVAGLGIMTVMMVSVSERTKEIGIKKAIGAKKRVILLEFLFEALALSLLGGMLGDALGTGIAYVASLILHFDFGISLTSILVSTGFAILIGVAFGVYPAVKAARLRPVDALRHE